MPCVLQFLTTHFITVYSHGLRSLQNGVSRGTVELIVNIDISILHTLCCMILISVRWWLFGTVCPVVHVYWLLVHFEQQEVIKITVIVHSEILHWWHLKLDLRVLFYLGRFISLSHICVSWQKKETKKGRINAPSVTLFLHLGTEYSLWKKYWYDNTLVMSGTQSPWTNVFFTGVYKIILTLFVIAKVK